MEPTMKPYRNLVSLALWLGCQPIACQPPSQTVAARPAAIPPSVVVRRTTNAAPVSTRDSDALDATTDSTLGEPEPASRAAPWWEFPYPTRFDSTQLSHATPRIRVEGNHFVNEAGAVVVFQGVSIADPDKLVREGQWKPDLFAAIHDWGANAVRVPVHPAAFRGLGRSNYFKLLDQAITWANASSLYVIIDWHSIGNLVTGLFQHPMYETTKQETYEFWRSVSYRYQQVPTAALYELFNEPTLYNGQLGKADWSDWRSINEDLIDIIRSHQNAAIPLVAGFDWAYDLSPVDKSPIKRPGVAYVSHPYPQKTTAPFEQKWEKTFGFIAKKYPLIATEIGYMPPDAPGAHVPVKDDGTYGKIITDFLAKRSASWIAWCFHPHWAPPLIADWSYKPTAAGDHFRNVMQARVDASTSVASRKESAIN